MKAFLVTCGDYADYQVDSIWLNRVAAEQYVKNDIDPETGYSRRGRYAPELEIEEWKVGVA